MASKQVKRQQELDRRERAAALRKQQQAQERRRTIVVSGAALIAVVAVVAGLVLASRHGKTSEPSAGPEVIPLAITGETTVQKPVVVVPDTSGIAGVVAYDTSGYPAGKADATSLEHQHVLGPVTYSLTPPVGGPHYGVWMNCGVYDKPVPTERAVHNLEHGAVWITYRPSLAAADVTTLRTLVLRQSKLQDGNRYLDLTPWSSEELPSPIVVSAWGHQLRLTSASDPRIQQFIDAFRRKQGITPEYGAACNGIPVDQGGRPAVS